MALAVPDAAAHQQAWYLLSGGLLVALLVATVVEVLLRRRAYALGLVHERTQDLAADRERLAEAQRIAHVGSWEWDHHEGALYWSEELFRIFGTEAVGFQPTFEDYLARIHHEDREMVGATVDATVASGEAFAFDHRIVRPDGEVRWLRCEGAVALDRDGRPAGLRGTAQDITDRRQIEDQFRDLLEAAPDGVVIIDGDGRIVLVNRQTEALFGWTREELVGQPVEILIPGRFRDQHTVHRGDYSADAQLRPMGAGLVLHAVRADGSEFPVEISLSPLRTDRGVLISAAVRDTTDRKRVQDALAHQALHDGLTGLPNRTLLADRLEQALARSARAGTGVAVLFIDLDRFKDVNDSLGHAAGDKLLVAVAERLCQVVRRPDTVARFGGDEFVVLCEAAAPSIEASGVAERIKETLRDPVVVDGHETFLSASIGAAVADGTDSAESLLRDADAAMYRAKKHGRARCEFFDATMRTEAVGRLETQTALHRAVERDELRVLYQPLVDLATGTVASVEALIRWAHPQHGLVSPDSFIPLAEETGLIVPLGAWLLDEVAGQLARWHESVPDRPLTMHVNLSTRQLRQAGLADLLAATLARTGIDPAALCLELTESSLMEDTDGHQETLAKVKALGVNLAIDDFGTGYSSLTYLKRFPVNVLKIDQTFVRGLSHDATDRAIVGSVIELAHALGLMVVAEGVETAEQVSHLRLLGCDQAQGFYFAAPQPPGDIEALLRANGAGAESVALSSGSDTQRQSRQSRHSRHSGRSDVTLPLIHG